MGRDINAVLASAFMNFAKMVSHGADHSGKIWAGSMLLIAMLHGLKVVPLIFVSLFFYDLWSFKVPKTPHKETASWFNVFLGRSFKLSQEHPTLRSNNNVSIARFQGKYFAAYRNADIHWPSKHASMIVATAEHPSGPWEVQWQHQTGEDLREMFLFEFSGKLNLLYCSICSASSGTFDVKGTRCFQSSTGKEWYTPHGRGDGLVSRAGELIWDLKVVKGADQAPILFKTSYLGGHYQSNGDQISVLFEQSTNAIDWTPCGSSKDSVVYRGGISEVAFEFTSRGDLVAIGRNEDGDSTGFGSQLFFAHASDLGVWQALKVSLPWRFDSPRMLRIEASGDILLLARYAYHQFDVAPKWMSRHIREFINIFLYSVRPKTAAIYRVTDPKTWVGGCGPWTTCSPLELVRFFEHGLANADTAFFSCVPHQEIPDCWHVANYTSVSYSNAWWVFGQVTKSDIYVAEMRIEVDRASAEGAPLTYGGKPSGA